MIYSAEFSPLSLESLNPIISTKWLAHPVFLFDQLRSTNTFALELTEKGATHGTVVLANSQIAGKGRLGRLWHSPPNMNIYCSVILTQPPPHAFISWIPLATGIAIAEAVEETANLDVHLKWPNDLLCHTQKLGGILCEASTKGPNGPAVIVGIGINVNCHESHFPPELREVATSLAIQTGRHFDRQELLTAVFSKLEFYYERIFDSDLSTLLPRYVSRCSTLGRHIEVSFPGNEWIEGIASQIGNEGELHIIPSNQGGESRNNQPPTISIRAADVIHLR